MPAATLPHTPVRRLPTPRIWLLPALILLIFLLLLFQLYRLLGGGGFTSVWPRTAGVERREATERPTAVPAVPPTAPAAPFRLAAAPHNVVFGSPFAPRKLIVFTDPACGACRTQLAAALQRLPARDVYVALKFAAAQPVPASTPAAPEASQAAIAGGLVEQLARQSGLTHAFHGLLSRQEEDLSMAELIQVLEEAGLPLRQQRELLRTRLPELLAAIAADEELYRRLGRPALPAFYLDNRLVSPALLAGDAPDKR